MKKSKGHTHFLEDLIFTFSSIFITMGERVGKLMGVKQAPN